MNELRYIYNIIKDDDLVKNLVFNRIYFYQVSEKIDTVQVDVETYKDEDTISLTKRISYLLRQYNFYQTSSQLTEYFKETKKYVRSIRYEGVPKNQYYKGEHIE